MRTIIILLLLVLVLGCIGSEECAESYIWYGGECCLDKNDNKVCDDQEMEKIVLVVKAPDPTCDDGVQNQGETGVDCSGPCEPCPPETCDDGVQNQGETGVDCGGPCEPCYQKPTSDESIQNQSWTDINSGDLDRSAYCAESTIRLTDTRQDAYVGDRDDPPDGIGDGVWLNGYNMVGDLADKDNATSDDQYLVIIAFPLKNISGKVSDARINVLPYMTQGTALDTSIEHIKCSGNVKKQDYTPSSDGGLGVLIKSSDPNDIIYTIDVTEYLQKDIDSRREYSCYRLYWNQTQLMGLNNNKVDRRILYGHGSQYAPYLTYIQRPCVRCKMNIDCGKTKYITDYQCTESKITRQYVHYRCAQPETEHARCIITQEVDDTITCKFDEECIDGEDQCFPNSCYENTTDYHTDYGNCGGKCRPCQCFNGIKDEGETGVDCGGKCKPCPTDRRLPVVKIVSPSRGQTYNSTSLYLRYLLNKDNVQCWFSINNDVNNTLEGDRFFNARKGENNLVIYCNDSRGNVGVGRVSFKVEPKKSMVCPSDDVGAEYKGYFDSVVFFMDNLSQIGLPSTCEATEFLPATTFDDTSKHFRGPNDLTKVMSDQQFIDNENATISYSCVSGLRHESGYAHVTGNMTLSNDTQLSLILYFREKETAISENSYWRAYLYNKDGDSVNNQTYVDIQYVPLNSSCDKELYVKYQELDITPLVSNMTINRADSIDVRMTIYSRNPSAALRLMEMEFSTD